MEEDESSISEGDYSDSLLGQISRKVVGLGGGEKLQTFLFNQAHAENGILTFQAIVKSPQGDLTKCHGNVILTSTICVGTNKNDTIVGPVGGGTIYGYGGNDKIQGLLSQQVIYGNTGNDTIQSGNGTNAIFGNEGDDTILGGSGFDILKGGAGSILIGGKGNDKLLGGPDHDILKGGAGNDFFQCSGKKDVILDFNPEQDKVSGDCITM